jgi:hypothetical protein
MCFSKENDHCCSNACVFQKQKLDHFLEVIHKVPHTIIQKRNSKMVFMWIFCYPSPLKNSRKKYNMLVHPKKHKKKESNVRASKQNWNVESSTTHHF